jgi:hypothetical protein
VAIKIKVTVENARDLEDLAHYADCGYHGPMLLSILVEAAIDARKKNLGRFPVAVHLDAGTFHPGEETESDLDPLEAGESDNPFAPARQTPVTA